MASRKVLTAPADSSTIALRPAAAQLSAGSRRRRRHAGSVQAVVISVNLFPDSTPRRGRAPGSPGRAASDETRQKLSQVRSAHSWFAVVPYFCPQFVDVTGHPNDRPTPRQSEFTLHMLWFAVPFSEASHAGAPPGHECHNVVQQKPRYDLRSACSCPTVGALPSDKGFCASLTRPRTICSPGQI